jgi:hypothetical protein
VVGSIGGWTDGHADKQIARQADRYTDKQVHR